MSVDVSAEEEVEVECADCNVHHVGNVEGLDAYCGVEGIIGYEKANYRVYHSPHHSFCCSGSGVDSVIDEGRSTERRHYPQPDPERFGGLYNRLIVCH